jgi:hypothetical protein
MLKCLRGLIKPYSYLDISSSSWDLGAQDRSAESTVNKQLQNLQADTEKLLERLKHAKARTQNQSWADTESQAEMIKLIVQDVQTIIKMHQRLLPS